ncbi:chromate efflux transporter [Microbacterium sp. HSID17254]|nr:MULTISPECIES: chromate efflux transporter [Actinomycetes]ALJ20924.1 chromate transporter [Microbacterium sp. No. 7]MCO5294454.1 chromate efflux transporter [Homoserinimonas sp.]RUQ04235.1 chromate efflux transporter [Microbacterium sp. HSID17254]WEG10051.1 chromate efflux transporter [Microbacterium sp. KACC 23027]
MTSETRRAPVRGSAWEVFRVFLRLGVTSFGGPIAHLGYFRTEIVERRRWMDDRAYADLVALCQFLPGPASSQVGFGIGLHRAGYRGALAAFIAFTLPSAALMLAFASGAALFTGTIGEGILAGLKIVAVAIVAQAVLGMAKTLTPDRQRAAIAAVAALAALLLAGSLGQIMAIVLGGIAGYFVCRAPAANTATAVRFPVTRAAGIAALTLFVAILAGMPILAAVTGNDSVALFDAFARAGALVFGGGHVVLPLLQSGVVDPGWVTNADFLAGYGAAQAVPGPLFTLAAFLGGAADVGPGGAAGAGIALAGIFLPGFLLLIGVLPFWNRLQHHERVQAIMRGANAAVVGILAAALYTPVFTTAILTPPAFALALVCFVLLVAWKLPPWIVVIIGAAGGILATTLT